MLDEAIDYLKSLQLQLQVLDGIISYAQVGSVDIHHRSYFSPLHYSMCSKSACRSEHVNCVMQAHCYIWILNTDACHGEGNGASGSSWAAAIHALHHGWSYPDATIAPFRPAASAVSDNSSQPTATVQRRVRLLEPDAELAPFWASSELPQATKITTLYHGKWIKVHACHCYVNFFFF